jgi:hypothetical protein
VQLVIFCLHLILHTCVQTFDVMDGLFLFGGGAKHDHSSIRHVARRGVLEVLTINSNKQHTYKL